jgi:ADP-ribose pyrophosphatase
MKSHFKWIDVTTEYREARPSKHGEELRWIVTRETILNTATGETVVRGTIRHPGICVIVPFVDDDRILLMHQYRYAAGEQLWELPAGLLQGRQEGTRVVPAETPEACAARELLEETGYRAGQLERVCECYAMPGSSDQKIYVFFARQLVQGEQSLDIGEVIEEVRPHHVSDLDRMIERAEIRDAKTLIGLFHARRRAAP